MLSSRSLAMRTRPGAPLRLEKLEMPNDGDSTGSVAAGRSWSRISGAKRVCRELSRKLGKTGEAGLPLHTAGTLGLPWTETASGTFQTSNDRTITAGHLAVGDRKS